MSGHVSRRAVVLSAAGCIVALSPLPARAQRCDAPHYRWDAKVSTALVTQAPTPTTITAMRTRWAIPSLGSGLPYWCAERVGAERQLYSITGWLRLADTSKDDGDWHLELTEGRKDAVDECIVVEIPAPRWGAPFTLARASLDSVLKSSRRRRDGRVTPPVRVRVVGPAFFDAEHLRGTTHPRAHAHGRCDGSPLSLWEIHPVYRIELP